MNCIVIFLSDQYLYIAHTYIWNCSCYFTACVHHKCILTKQSRPSPGWKCSLWKNEAPGLRPKEKMRLDQGSGQIYDFHDTLIICFISPETTELQLGPTEMEDRTSSSLYGWMWQWHLRQEILHTNIQMWHPTPR